MLFIVGMTRGGNTWLGKIFDAHPDVLYRHEPDSILKTKTVPAFCGDQDVEHYLPAAKTYFDAVFRVRTSKAIGTFPVLPKSYHSFSQHQLKRAMVVGAKGFEKLGFLSSFFRDLPLPEMTGRVRVHHVVKSIAALGRMNLFSRLYPEARIILLLRHPGGQVASALKAIASDKIDGQPPATEDWGIYQDLAETEQGRRHGLTLASFKESDPVERLAWRWAISNDKALEDLDGQKNVRVVRYEDLCIPRSPSAGPFLPLPGWIGIRLSRGLFSAPRQLMRPTPMIASSAIPQKPPPPGGASWIRNRPL